ncbi:MAG: glutamine--fructose-6-phosphate transaminase (isomerizing) [Lachnospiraceae bacterium]|nr:glutamine--fructose-6-phosphate transaminase (isomerizing) [Lachnospiraceae bacterium]
MCGIVGYVGPRKAAPVLLEGLAKLEYRGYDSAGISVRDGRNDPVTVKVKGRLSGLVQKTNGGEDVPGCCGIGHTRWATHGEPSETNAHPHVSPDNMVVGVHNGIVENYQELRGKLERKGYTFYSQTDTEILIDLVDYYYRKYKVGPIDALAKTMVRVRGSYALAVMFKDYPDVVFAMRKDSPMIVGRGKNESFLASDVPAILKYTRDVYYVDNLEMVRLSGSGITFFNLDGDVVDKELSHIDWDAEAAEKGGFEHFMMKEIYEEPKALQDTLNSVLGENGLDLGKIGLDDETIRGISDITITACGSAYHTGVVAQYVTESLTRIPVRVELASEFRYRDPILRPGTLVIIISQSGETADSLAALREAKARGAKTLAIVNVLGSSIAREADYVYYTLAGPEIAVATTKAYSAQLMALYTLAVKFAIVRGTISAERYAQLLKELSELPEKTGRILENKEKIQRLASEKCAEKDIFYIGRGIDYAVSLEGSLKFKEISYIHSEAYAAGELKHGTISLIEEGTPVIGVITQEKTAEKTVSNLVECQSRGAYVIAVTREGLESLVPTADYVLTLPAADELFMASVTVVPLQLIAYYVSVSKGLDVDKPRNLAKSVTVE